VSDPVSWFVIEAAGRSWTPPARKSERSRRWWATPERTSSTGSTIATGILGKPVYVPAERVREITEGRISSTSGADEVKRLEPYEPPAP
jgi:hypothetical protein